MVRLLYSVYKSGLLSIEMQGERTVWVAEEGLFGHIEELTLLTGAHFPVVSIVPLTAKYDLGVENLIISSIKYHPESAECHPDSVEEYSGTVECQSDSVEVHSGTDKCHCDTDEVCLDTAECHCDSVECHCGTDEVHLGTEECHSGIVETRLDTAECHCGSAGVHFTFSLYTRDTYFTEIPTCCPTARTLIDQYFIHIFKTC